MHGVGLAWALTVICPDLGSMLTGGHPHACGMQVRQWVVPAVMASCCLMWLVARQEGINSRSCMLMISCCQVGVALHVGCAEGDDQAACLLRGVQRQRVQMDVLMRFCCRTSLMVARVTRWCDVCMFRRWKGSHPSNKLPDPMIWSPFLAAKRARARLLRYGAARARCVLQRYAGLHRHVSQGARGNRCRRSGGHVFAY